MPDTKMQIRNSARTTFLMPFPHSSAGFMLFLPESMLSEFARLPESVSSFNRYINDVVHPKYTLLGPKLLINNIHKPVISKELQQKLVDKMPMIDEEMASSLEDVVTAQVDNDGKATINVWDTALRILSRTSNRVIVGAPLCRNQEYLDAVVNSSVAVFPSGIFIRLIPGFLRP